MVQAKKDENGIPVLMGVSNADGVTPIMVYVDPVTHRLLVDLAGGSGTVTSVSIVTANGISGSVATATTTPAITLTLGAITPSAVQISGLTASEIVGTDASKNLVSLAVATYPSLTELTYVKGVTSAIQTQMNLKAPLASPTFTGTVTVPTPTNATDAVTKAYADAITQSLDIKQSVRVASTVDIAVATALINGSTIDGVVVATGDRVLLKNQTAGAENGIYVVVASGVASRSTDADVSADVTSGMYVFVSEGTVSADMGYVLTTNDPITLGTTALSFTQFSGAGQITAGTGLTKTGNTLAIDTAVVVDKTTAQTLTNKTLTSPVINTPTGIVKGDVGLGNVDNTSNATERAATATLGGKRINPRLVTAASYTTDTGTSLDVSTCDQFEITAQAGALLFNAPGGTPLGGQKLVIRIKDNGTARALTWNAVFRAMGTALPSTTVLSKTLYLGFFYNATDTKWDLVASGQEA